ncbi:hypothetical protein C8J57DRAFT_1712698 [Mycena rebaudengoi]|nr:hypothetical protein C8J57DRAFT_1712698 [Mycena rebaudengoi]
MLPPTESTRAPSRPTGILARRVIWHYVAPGRRCRGDQDCHALRLTSSKPECPSQPLRVLLFLFICRRLCPATAPLPKHTPQAHRARPRLKAVLQHLHDSRPRIWLVTADHFSWKEALLVHCCEGGWRSESPTRPPHVSLPRRFEPRIPVSLRVRVEIQVAEKWTWGADRIYGLNLGGWFVLEPCASIAPALFQQYPSAGDEWALSTLMRADGTLQAKMEQHYDTFIVSLRY